MAARRWSKAEALRQVRRCVDNPRLTLHWKEKALEAELKACGLIVGDVLHLLRRGRIIEQPTVIGKTAYRCRVSSRTPNSARAVTVTVVLNGGCEMKIMNICRKE